MARIRSIKPEYWSDRSLARQLSRDARLLYIALWNFADEHGRLPGDSRWVKGNCLPYDDDLDPPAIEQLLGQLAAAGKIVAYEADGDPYLHLPNLAKHQRLEAAKVPSRLPAPPQSDGPSPGVGPDHTARGAGKAQQGADRSGHRVDGSAPGADEDAPSQSSKVPERSMQVKSTPAAGRDESAPRADCSAPAADQREPGAEPSATIVALQVAGGREQGVPPTAGSADAPRGDVTAQQLIAEYVTSCVKRPPRQVLGHLGKEIAAMLAEGIDSGDIRSGLAAWHAKGLHPSTLPSVVHEVMNGPPKSGQRQSADDLFARAMKRAQARDAVEVAR
jgi:hypothetical protein